MLIVTLSQRSVNFSKNRGIVVTKTIKQECENKRRMCHVYLCMYIEIYNSSSNSAHEFREGHEKYFHARYLSCCFSVKYMKREKVRDLTQYSNLCGLNTLPH